MQRTCQKRPHRGTGRSSALLWLPEDDEKTGPNRKTTAFSRPPGATSSDRLVKDITRAKTTAGDSSFHCASLPGSAFLDCSDDDQSASQPPPSPAALDRFRELFRAENRKIGELVDVVAPECLRLWRRNEKMSTRSDHQTVPLSVLLKRELANEKIDRPEIVHGQASQSKKGEDYTLLKTECQRIVGDGVTTYSVFALFDGHNGSAAAVYSKEHLLNNILRAMPSDLNRDEWVTALPRALVAGFVKTDKDFQEKSQTSGTTVTFLIIEGWVITVASVGDSRCILESAEGTIYYLSADHRLECNEEERTRITASGGEVGRLNTGGGAEIGPLRCWPGGLCLSRSIGDMDVGEFIVPVPYVKQVKLSTAGGRIIISSDGVWDALSAEAALDCCRGMPPDAAAAQIVKESLHEKGLRDDTTCIVIDILPQEKPVAPLPPPKKPGRGVFKSMFRKKSSESSSQNDQEYIEPDVVEELYEDGSATLSERLDTKYPLCNMFRLFMCAVCQVELKPGDGISIHAGSSNPGKLRPWDGPFLCLSCQEKKEAMEGRRPFGDGSSRHSSGSD